MIRKKLQYNLDHLVLIVTKDKKPVRDLEWQPYKKFKFWPWPQREGFYERDTSNVWTTEQLEGSDNRYYGEKILVEDKVAYFKPYVKLCFLDNHSETIYFNNYTTALVWSHDLADRHMPNRYATEHETK